MNHFTFSALLLSITSLFIAATMLVWRNPKSRAGRLFALYWFSIAFWSFFVGWQENLRHGIPEIWWGWFLHLGCLFIPTIFLHFAVVYSGHSTSIVPKWAYVLTVGYLITNTLTTFFTNGISHRDAYAYPTPSVLYPMYFLSFVASIVYGALIMIRAAYQKPKSERYVLVAFITAHILGYLGGMDNFLIMADVRVPPLYPYGLYLAVLYAVVSGFLVLRYRFPETASLHHA